MKALYENHYLSDRDVANYARHSFAKLADNFTEDQNNSLIRFLARGMQSGDWENLISTLANNSDLSKARELATYLRKIPEHWIPFGHPHITLRMEAPVPIRTQCFKHKIGFVESEESRRYISSTPKLYVPEFFRAKPVGSIKQGSGQILEKFTEAKYCPVFEEVGKTGFVRTSDPVAIYKSHGEHAISLYKYFIEQGVCPEQARFVLPQGCEVNWVWTGSLYAFANFYNQRSDSHAQKEIQDLAKQVDSIIAPLYPVSWKALTQGIY